MAEKDMTEKALLSFNDVFSDIVNNLVFKGERQVAEDELKQATNRGVYLGETAFREMERDVSKIWKKNNIRIAMFGFENETEAEDDMPFRVLGYDGLSYRDQIRYEADDQGKRRKVGERYPVITLVLYFGFRNRWNKARTLHEALGDKLRPEMKELVSDYRINIYEIAYLTDEELQGFHSDFKYLAEYFVQKQRTGTYTGSMEELHHAREVLYLFSALTGDERYFATTRWEDGTERRIHNMCEVLDIIEKRGYDTGYDTGFDQGEEAQARKDAIGMYQNGLTVDIIATIIRRDVDTVQQWIEEAGEDS